LSIPNLLDRVERASGARKAALLAENDSPLLRRVLLYAYDPYRVFYVHKFDLLSLFKTDLDPGVAWFESAFRLLDDLSSRKLTGNEARNAVSKFHAASGVYADLFESILKKDLRCGIAATTIHKVFPGLLPKYGVMLAQNWKPTRYKPGEEYIVDWKNNGHRYTAVIEPGKAVQLLSRTGREQAGYEAIKNQLAEVGKIVGGYLEIDGELMVGMTGNRKQQEADAVFIAFDMPAHPELFVKGDPGNWARIVAMQGVLNAAKYVAPKVVPSKAKLAKSLAEVDAYYQEVVNIGGEGIMVKVKNGKYVRDRSWNWMKYKPVNDADLKIVGRYEGEGKYAGMLGGVIVAHHVEDPDHPMYGKTVNVEVGSGWTDAERWDYWFGKHKDNLIGRTLEVLYFEVTPYGSLLNTRVSRDPKTKKVRFRNDK
jgi:hypothetical protein